MRFSNIVETICRSETSETEDTSSDNHSMASEDDDLRARRAGNIKLSAREKSLCYRYDQPIDKQCASSSGSDKEQGYNTVVALERVATESKRVGEPEISISDVSASGGAGACHGVYQL